MHCDTAMSMLKHRTGSLSPPAIEGHDARAWMFKDRDVKAVDKPQRYAVV